MNDIRASNTEHKNAPILTIQVTCMFLGDSCVGKTFLLSHYLNQRYIQCATAGVEYHTVQRQINTRQHHRHWFNTSYARHPSPTVRASTENYRNYFVLRPFTTSAVSVCAQVGFWDVIGYLRYQNIIDIYLKFCNIVFLIYDSANSQSFQNLSTWLTIIRNKNDTSNTTPKMVCVIGNNFTSTPMIDKKTGEHWAITNDCHFFELTRPSHIQSIVDEMILRYATLNPNKVVHKSRSHVRHMHSNNDSCCKYCSIV